MIYFVLNVSELNTEEAFTATITGNNDKKEDLFFELKEKLLFPDYFGNNWDALYDCLCDLNWINASKIILFHKEIPRIDDKLLAIYLNILNDAVKLWEKDSSKSLEVIFELKDLALITDILNKY